MQDLQTLREVLLRNDPQQLQRWFASRPDEDHQAALRGIASQAIDSRNWALAVSALMQLTQPDSACQLQLNLARNLAAMQQARPETYAAIVAAPQDGRFQLAASATSLPTIFFSQDGKTTSFSPNNDPLAGTRNLFGKLKSELDRGLPLALCGLGDGYLLGAIAQHPPKLFMTMQQTVHLIEPHAQVVMLCMMIHDYSGETGPIRQERFRWSIGQNWRDTLRQDLLGDLCTPIPMITISQGIDAPLAARALQQINEQLAAEDSLRRRELESYYASLPREHWIERLGSFPNQPPRVMLLTTRFSTVLQYSTRDAAEAFGQLGWETLVLIEPSDWQRNSGLTIRKALAEFKPDLMFQIDHLRHEHGQLFPPQLPFACWIQDHLPNLCNTKAGAAVSERDYVLSGMGSLFVQRHGYPRRQVVDLPQLSRVPMRPTEWTSDGEDIVYVSNWSRTAEQIVPELLARFANPPALRPLIERCCQQIIDRYTAGQCVATHYDVRLILSDCEQATGVSITHGPMKDEVINVIFDRLNNTLYRHQSLQWAAEIARSMGLKLGLYGRGWEEHPAFAPYARGAVAPGEALERLTRQSKINLQLEPYACFSHARLLSGLFAGGFYLIRDHPFNTLTQELLNFIDRSLPDGICTVEQARRAIKPKHADQLEEMLARSVSLGEQVDPISMVRDWQRGGTLIAQAISLPRLNEVLFSSRESFEAQVRRVISNAELRYDISSEQRQNTQSRLSYRAGLDRTVRAIAKLIAAEHGTDTAQAA